MPAINRGAAARLVRQDFNRAGWPGPAEKAVGEGDEKAVFISFVKGPYLLRVASSGAYITAPFGPEIPYLIPCARKAEIVRGFVVSEAQGTCLQAFGLPFSAASKLDVKGVLRCDRHVALPL